MPRHHFYLQKNGSMKMWTNKESIKYKLQLQGFTYEIITLQSVRKGSILIKTKSNNAFLGITISVLRLHARIHFLRIYWSFNCSKYHNI